MGAVRIATTGTVTNTMICSMWQEEQARREHQEKIVSLREDRDGKRSREVTDHLR